MNLGIAGMALIVICLGLGLAPAVSGEVIIVDDDWPGSDYSTIQDAVNNATEDDTILVYEGTYQENVNVNQSVMIVGNGTSTLVTGIGGPYVFLLGNGSHLFNVSATNATVGVMMTSSNNVTVQGCFIFMNEFGIRIYGSSHCMVARCTVWNNSRFGIISTVSSNVWIHNSTVFNHTQRWNSIGIGVLSGSHQVLVENNTVSNSSIDCIEVWNGSSAVSIENNEVYGSEYGILLLSCSSIWVQDNYIHNTTVGMGLGTENGTWGYPAYVMISGNDIWNCSESGMEVYGTTNAVFRDNRVEKCRIRDLLIANSLNITVDAIRALSDGDGGWFQNCTNSMLVNATFAGGTGFGLLIERSSSFQMVNVTVTKFRNYGVKILSTSCISGVGLVIGENDLDGLILTNVSSACFIACSHHNGGNGVVITHGSINNTIMNSSIYMNSENGILITSGSPDNRIMNTQAYLNAHHGIDIGFSKGNVIVNVSVSHNGAGGLRLILNSHNTTIINSTFRKNQNQGIYVSSVNNLTIWNSELDDNGVGAYLYEVGGFQMMDLTIYGNSQYGLDLYGSCTNGMIAWCEFYDNGEGLRLTSVSSTLIQGCSFHDDLNSGISGHTSQRIRIVNNTFSSDVLHLSCSTRFRIESNAFIGGGLTFTQEDVDHITSHTYLNNTVNGRPLITIFNQSGSVNASLAGSLVVANVTGMVITDINITDTDRAVQIYHSENVTVKGAETGESAYGIILISCADITISECEISNTTAYGIYVSGASGMISDSRIINCSNGLYIVDSDDLIVRNSTFVSGDYGVYLLNSTNVAVLNSIIRQNTWGIYMYHHTTYSRILNCSIHHNSYGIYIYYYVSNVEIAYCEIYRNSNYGIYMGLNTSDNLVHHDNFYENGGLAQAYDETGENGWNATGEGNYWDDYTGSDLNNDGIGDEPYPIAGTGGSKDWRPLMNPVNTSAPERIPEVSMIILSAAGTILIYAIYKRR